MRVTALGTADALCASGRGTTAWLVDDARGSYAVDFGPTALLALRKLGRDPAELDAVHFTHLHGDHIAGWPFLLLGERTRPLLASGPPGTRERLQTLWAACYADSAERPLRFELTVVELQPGETRELCGRKIAAFRAQHMGPRHVALSLRIDGAAFSGDTGKLPEGLCTGAKVLCCECTYAHPGNLKHLDWETLQRELPDVPRVFVGHLGEEARRIAVSSGKVHICDDLDSFEVP
ncbi:MAG TPA: MBL fold metallo-hydrolase [Myxococcales bacterium]|nr:MBL fold metallo-hydrolase [Myxococcales bacterium]